MPDGAKLSSDQTLMTPELLRTVAEAVGAALSGRTSAEAGRPAVQNVAAPVTPNAIAQAPLGESLGAALAPLVAPILVKADGRLKSRKLWTLIGTALTLLCGNAPAVNLPPVTQVCLAVVAGLYIVAQAVVDSAGKSRSGEARP